MAIMDLFSSYDPAAMVWGLKLEAPPVTSPLAHGTQHKGQKREALASWSITRPGEFLLCEQNIEDRGILIIFPCASNPSDAHLQEPANIASRIYPQDHLSMCKSEATSHPPSDFNNYASNSFASALGWRCND